MKLVMTLLVRDEQDILRDNLDFHLSRGVDFVLATDNRSVDETPSILAEYAQKGVLEYRSERADNFNQHEWVTRMAREAYAEHRADWVINSDADEFWWPLAGNLKEALRSVPEQCDLVKVHRHNFVPVETTNAPFFRRMIYRQRQSLNPLGRPLPPKVT